MSAYTIEWWAKRPRTVVRLRGKKHVIRDGWRLMCKTDDGNGRATYRIDGRAISRLRAEGLGRPSVGITEVRFTKAAARYAARIAAADNKGENQ